MTAFIQSFHFLRPWWLLALLPVAGLLLYRSLLLHKRDVLSSTFAPHLLPYLLIEPENSSRIKPAHILPVIWLLSILALAGPSWRQEPSPFAEDKATLIIALKMTPSMEGRDIQPSRLQRSVQKIGDLLERRRGARTALVAYAGSSHLVMPLTRDDSVITTFARELSPQIMPKDGNDITGALALSANLLKQDGAAGSIILITDGIGAELHPQLKSLRDNGFSPPVNILAVAAPPGSPIPVDSPPAPALDRNSLEAGAKIIGAKITEVTVDSTDVDQLNRNIVRDNERRVSGDGQRWRDSGWQLLFPIALLTLFWSRRGWFLRWEKT